ncbi:MAG: YihY/virulence factor BrkB family protein [Candidatus Eremiobacteraeota bacterium]|nr:YihY/virulence factor BrkB family protein [Candidatus Eremiobacteraeota bacterium]MBV9057220.1 YihY/virulence factor BrkB family protein [Candidatus Eremiobacteraeota bacterium]
MGTVGRAAVAAIVPLAKETFSEFQRHKSQWLAAAISYFTMVAIAPLVIVIVEIAGLVLGHHRVVLHQLYGYLASTAGPSAAHGIQSIVAATFAQRKAGLFAQIVGWVVFVLAAVGLFASLQEALNTVWDVTPKKRGLVDTLKERVLSFGMVLGIAFVLLVSLGINSAMTVAGAALAGVAPLFPSALKVLDFILSLGLITLVFALLFEYLPECRISWRDVWLGAAVSALLFVIGQFLLGWYLGRAGISSSYGTFGGLVVFLIWAFYSAQILLIGAEFTHVYARRFGSQRSGAARGQSVPTPAAHRAAAER